jgi:hypothetical protein
MYDGEYLNFAGVTREGASGGVAPAGGRATGLEGCAAATAPSQG